MIVLIVNNSDLNAITAQSKFQNMFQVQFIGKFQIKDTIVILKFYRVRKKFEMTMLSLIEKYRISKTI